VKSPRQNEDNVLGRKVKAEVIYPGYSLNPHHTQRLDSLRAIRIEQSRLYRATIRGRLPSEELTKLFFCLREIRATLEAEIAAAPLAAASIKEIHIQSIPANSFVINNDRLADEHESRRAGGHSFMIEHQPAPDETPVTTSVKMETEPEVDEAPIEPKKPDDGGVLLVRSAGLRRRRSRPG
jgi:hypothetical protein